jgi:LysR family glycine cleavage system transcriptional activator
LRDGNLICPVRNPPRISQATQWIVCPVDHLRKNKVSVFIDWLRAEVALWQAEQLQYLQLPFSK